MARIIIRNKVINEFGLILYIRLQIIQHVAT